MKLKFLLNCLFFLPLLFVFFNANAASNDTAEVKKINRLAYSTRLSNPGETIKQAKKALALAQLLKYPDGEAEAYRELGIGYYYETKPDSAIQAYLEAKKIYEANNNLKGRARVLNNIGVLYRETADKESIRYFNMALDVAKQMKDEDLQGNIYMNLGNGYNNLKNYNAAIDYYNRASDIFSKLKKVVYITQCLQNKGDIYYKRGQLDTAETFLLLANDQAKANRLNETVAGVDLSLARVYTAKGVPKKADHYWAEGFTYAKDTLKNVSLEYNYKSVRYQMLRQRKAYKEALDVEREVFVHDSTAFNSKQSNQLVLLEAQYKQNEQEAKNLRTIEESRYARSLFVASTIVTGLLAIVIFLLVNNVNRKAKVNKSLTALNEQISEQKENLNQINHHLEEIIDERTKDLQVKNKKLADYSLHLSHQIRGPIATLKGLLNLERDKLIEKDECIKLMNKCVSDIDENIIDMSGMLHDSAKTVTRPKT